MNPAERIVAYFDACTSGSAADIAAHFTADAVIYDTNVRPVVGADEIGRMWVAIRDQWQGARWSVESLVTDGTTAAIEWSMTGRDPDDERAFTFRGSEHYAFGGPADQHLIAEIRQYWTFDRTRLETGLRHYPYAAPDEGRDDGDHHPARLGRPWRPEAP